MNSKFDTIEEAKTYLEIRRKDALLDLEKKGYTVLNDSSHVYFDCLFTQKWGTMLLITTQEMIDDLMKIKPFDSDEELRIIKEIQDGKNC